MRTQTTPMRTAAPTEEWMQLRCSLQAARLNRIKTRAGVLILIALLVLGLASFFLFGSASSSYANAGTSQSESTASLFDAIDQAAEDVRDANETNQAASQGCSTDSSTLDSPSETNASACVMDADPTDQPVCDANSDSASRGEGESNVIFDGDATGNVACAP